jgi:small subunit ribosomal protein S1
MSGPGPLEYSPDAERSTTSEVNGESQAGMNNGTANAEPATAPQPTAEMSPAVSDATDATEEAPERDFKPSPGWDRAAESYAQGSTLDLKVIGYNRGGLLVDLADVRGFVPASQLINFPRRVGEEERMNELARYVGKNLHLKVIELDRVHNRLILSERVASLPVSRAEQVIISLQPGQTVRGTVRNVTDFGAFVDLGGVEGLIHVSEMSWQRVGHPRDVCTPGAEIEVYVIDVNREQRRVGLSIKRLRPDPWSLVGQRYHVGDIVDAVITNVVSFGAFARLPEGVEGLIHTSELAEGSFLHPRDVVREGQPVKVRIMNIEPARQRIGLTLRLKENARDRAREAPSGPSIPDAGYWDSLARES